MIKILELFGGIGSPRCALRNIGIAGLIQLGDLSVGAAGVGNVVTELTYDSKTGKFTATKGIKALTESDLQEITQQEIKALFA